MRQGEHGPVYRKGMLGDCGSPVSDFHSMLKQTYSRLPEPPLSATARKKISMPLSR